jgi:transposase-like protein
LARRKGDTAPARLERQQLVCRYFLRGLTVPEVARQLGVSVRTIQLDFQEIKSSLFDIIQTRELRTLKLALMELDELWREAWILYHRPSQERRDDRSVKAMLIMDLMRISAEKNRLLIPTNAKDTEGARTQEIDGVRLAAEIIETLPVKSKDEIIRHLRSTVKGGRIERPSFDEQLAREVEELRNNEELRRMEGLEPDDAFVEAADSRRRNQTGPQRERTEDQ